MAPRKTFAVLINIGNTGRSTNQRAKGEKSKSAASSFAASAVSLMKGRFTVSTTGIPATARFIRSETPFTIAVVRFSTTSVSSKSSSRRATFFVAAFTTFLRFKMTGFVSSPAK